MEADVILQTIAPEVCGATAVGAIAVADLQIAPGLCGDRRPMLVAYLAAHILTLTSRAGASGPVTSQSEGGLSESFGTVAGSRNNLTSTSYGAEFERLSRACAGTLSAMTRMM